MNWFNRKSNVLVTGAKGQLGSYLVAQLQKLAFKEKSKIGKVFGIDINDLDLTDSYAVSDFFNRNVFDPSVKLDYVIHCAAATDTTAIEKDPLKFYASTAIGTKNVAETCAYNGIKMIHISTDYVLSELSPVGSCGNRVEFPVNQYGMHKLIAEKEAQLAYWQSGHPERLLVGRLSWLFGNSRKSFVEKLLASICKTYAKAYKMNKCVGERIEHEVVDDAFGKPTPVKLVLNNVIDAIETKRNGIADFQYYGAQISRLEWAQMIWSSFCNELDNNVNDNAFGLTTSSMRNALVKMRVDVVLKGVKSSALNLGMRHPGRIVPVIGLSDDSSLPSYQKCTADYIHDNFDRLLNETMYTALEEEGIA